MARRYYQGLFRPKNPQKYKGNPTNICYRSSWEHKVMLELDNNPDVVQWASEEGWFSIGYRHPVDGKIRRYFPDFWVKTKKPDGTFETSIIEVKPLAESVAPPLRKNGSKDQRYVRKAVTYAINEAKWSAVSKYCEMKGWAFKVITEKDLR